MRHAFVLLATLTLASLNACGPVNEPREGLTIRVQGTVTAADDGSPIAGARISVTGPCFVGCAPPTDVFTTTDDSGRYSLSFDWERTCSQARFILRVSAEGFRVRNFESMSVFEPHVRCIERIQTIDVQLDTLPPSLRVTRQFTRPLQQSANGTGLFVGNG